MEDSKQNKITLLRQMIENAERNITAARQVLSQIDNASQKAKNSSIAAQVIEGAFDGEGMIGLDGKKYPIPPNYASKSKLVEGDLLKLTITEDGSFLYKQISPADRRKIIGNVMIDDKRKFYVASEGRKYKVLLASLTYFKAKEGDEVAIIVPKEKISKWAAIEAVLEKSDSVGISEEEKGKDSYAEEESQCPSGKEEKKKQARKKNEEIKRENKKEEMIEDEWTPNLEEIKKETRLNKSQSENDGISDEL